MSIYRKAIVIGGINCASFSNGFVLGQMASMIQSLRRKEDGIILTDGQISFIASSVVLVSSCGMALAAIVSDKLGRRWAFTIFSIPSVINWIILHNANSMFAFMLSRLLAGIAVGALVALKLCVTSEYTDANTRGLFLNMISTFTPAVGTTVAHGLGIILHWRTVALIGLIPPLIGIFIPYFWLESPHWLASKGRFNECQDVFTKLHGSSPNKDSELKLLLKLEKAKLQKAEETNSVKAWKKLLIACRKKYFWNLMMLSVFISAFLAGTGIMPYSTLAVTIIEGITGSSKILLFTLIVDFLKTAGACASCVLVTKISMRTMLFTTSFIAVGILVTLSAFLYFKPDSMYLPWVNVSLLGFYFFILKAGPYPVLEAILGEIYPLELKVYCFFLTGTVLMTSLALTVALLPLSVTLLGYHGLFLLNACIMSFCLGYIYITLPETKGRTLQEIEIYFKTKNFQEIDEMFRNEEIKALI